MTYFIFSHFTDSVFNGMEYFLTILWNMFCLCLDQIIFFMVLSWLFSLEFLLSLLLLNYHLMTSMIELSLCMMLMSGRNILHIQALSCYKLMKDYLTTKFL